MRFKTAGIRTEQRGDVLHISVLGEIDHHSAKDLREQIDGELFRHRPRTLVLSLSDVGFMDSSGLGLILGRLALARGMGCRLHLCDMTPQILKILALAGVSRLEGITLEREGKEKEREKR
ncbi:MAG: STAS domain-containing protein [Clostridia bacterium]|nr:STAS domain-containing protein [Clostridia bacterium]